LTATARKRWSDVGPGRGRRDRRLRRQPAGARADDRTRRAGGPQPEELERQAREAAGTDAAIFPSLMLVQTRGDEIAAAPEWLRPQTTVEDYLRGVLG